MSIAEAPDDNHYFITGKIAEYTQAFDRCDKAAKGRELPSNRIIAKLANFTQSDIERLLMSKAVLVRQECEKPELTELAYAILIIESEELQQQTLDAISAIKVLAFSGDVRKFQAIYQSVPAEFRQKLEKSTILADLSMIAWYLKRSVKSHKQWSTGLLYCAD